VNRIYNEILLKKKDLFVIKDLKVIENKIKVENKLKSEKPVFGSREFYLPLYDEDSFEFRSNEISIWSKNKPPKPLHKLSHIGAIKDTSYFIF
jgi:hypothetical protein